MASSNELPQKSNIEIVDAGELTPEIRETINSFIAKQVDLLKDDPELEAELFEYGLRLTQAHIVMSSAIQSHMQWSNVTFAKKGTEIVGLSFVAIAENGEKQFFTFTGVARLSQREGIATKLVSHRHHLLKEKGVEQYSVSLWEGSLGVFKKLENKGEVNLTPLSDKKVLVRLVKRD